MTRLTTVLRVEYGLELHASGFLGVLRLHCDTCYSVRCQALSEQIEPSRVSLTAVADALPWELTFSKVLDALTSRPSVEVALADSVGRSRGKTFQPPR